MRARKRRPMFMVDIAVPRDIDADVAELEDVYLFTVDDLQSVVNENLEGRRQAAREARRADRRRGRAVRAPAAHARRGAADPAAARGRRAHATRTRSSRPSTWCTQGRSAEEALRFLANTLTNRLIHAPSQRLRDAAETGDCEIARRDRRTSTGSTSRTIDEGLDPTPPGADRRPLRGSERTAGRPGRDREAEPVPRPVDGICAARAGRAALPRIHAGSRTSCARPRRWRAGPTPRCASWPRTKPASCASASRPKAFELTKLLVPRDPRDDANIFLEIRAGTGGDEAAIFAGDLFRMYCALRRAPGLEGRGAVATARASTAATRKSSAASSARAPTRSSSSSRARIACSACRPPNRRAASTPRPAPSRSCPSSTRSTTSPINPADLRIDTYPRLGRGRPARQQDRLGDPHHAPADRHRRRVPGRALAAQEPLARDVAAARAPARSAAAETGRRSRRRTASCRSAPATAPSASGRTITRRGA